MPKPETHVFVCTSGSFCWYDGDCEGLLEALKQRVAAAGLKDSVRINRTGCLNACGHGPTVVVYPQGDWYGNVQLADADELFAALRSGEPVTRLLLPPDFVKHTEHYPAPVQQFKRVERALDDQRRSAQDAIRAAEAADAALATDAVPSADAAPSADK